MKNLWYLMVSGSLSPWPRFWDPRPMKTNEFLPDSKILVILSNPIIFRWKTYDIWWFRTLWASGPDSEIPDQWEPMNSYRIQRFWWSSQTLSFSNEKPMIFDGFGLSEPLAQILIFQTKDNQWIPTLLMSLPPNWKWSDSPYQHPS